jgi:hypothetical protein
MKHARSPKYTPLWVVLLFSLCIVSLSAQEDYTPVSTESFPAGAGSIEILILSRNTEFKSVVRTAIIEALNEEGISVLVDDMGKTDLYDAAQFEAVILLSGIQAFRPLPEAIDYIIRNDYADNIVYVSTYSLFATPYGRSLKRNQVDAITAASKVEKKDKVDRTINEILTRVFDILG